MNSNLIEISINKVTYNYLLSILLKRNILYKNLQINNNEITLITSISDYKKLKREIKSIKIKSYLGINKFLSWIKTHYVLLISFIISYIVLIILSNVIFEIEIVSSNKEIKRIIELYLKENDIEKYKFMKSTKELNKIKEEILNENKETLEWIEIERLGTKYIINITERVINNPVENNTPSNIVAKKDATITYLVAKKGTRVKEINEIVKKGEVIISGDIIKDEEIVNSVNAEGEVYGEVWYTVNITVPYTHVEYEKTGKTINHIYMNIFGKKITLMGKYETSESMNTTTVLLDKPYLFFKIMKEQKELYKYVTHNLTEEEAYEEAIKRGDKGINASLGPDEYIIDKKVLKKNAYSSKIEVEIFYKVYENIGEKKEIVREEIEGE